MFRNTLRTRVEETESRLAKLEHAHKLLQLEWTEVYDKAYRMLQRLAQRDRREKSSEDRAGAPIEEVGPTYVSPAAQRILQRRSRLNAIRSRASSEQR